jgi:tetratricopeptide (TPR) repeat protein
MNQSYRGNFLMQAGRAYMQAGQTDKALAILSEAEKTEKNAVIYMARFECYEKLKQWNNAIGDLNRAEAEAIRPTKANLIIILSYQPATKHEQDATE